MKAYLSAPKFKLLFAGIVILDLVVGSSGFSEYRVLTKPLILLSLLIFFAFNGKQLSKPSYFLMLFALLFSLAGDVILLFDSQSNTYFMLGLVSFLLAHLIYGAVFLKKRNKKPAIYLYGVAMILIAIGMLLFFYIRDGLGSLTYPVIVYILGILCMAITALMRIGKVPTPSFLWVFTGALLFVFSDSILAIDMFKSDVPWSNILIMGSYAAAQFLIVFGILKEMEATKNLSTLS